MSGILKDWTKTKIALSKLEKLLNCTVCDGLLTDPCSLNSCDHSFCRVCATVAVNSNSKCPECGSFAWLKDLQDNRQLGNTADFCKKLKTIISRKDQDCNQEVYSARETAKIPTILYRGGVDTDNAESTSKNQEKAVPRDENGTIISNEIPNQRYGDFDNSVKEQPPKAVFTKLIAVPVKDNDEVKGKEKVSMIKDANEHETEDNMHEKAESKEVFGKECDNDKAHNLMKGKKKTAVEENIEVIPSWPVSAKKPKKALRTYGNRSKSDKIDPRVLPHKNSTLNSDIDADASDRKTSKINTDPFTVCDTELASISDKNKKDLFVYDEEKIVEIENDFFHNAEECIDDCNDFDRKFISEKEGKMPVTRLRRRHPVSTKSRTVESKGSKRRNHEVAAENPRAAKKKTVAVISTAAMKRNKKGETPLHVAAIQGKYDTAKQLLESNADPNTKDFAGWTPLHEACNHGCFEIVQLLLDFGAFIDAPGCDHDTPLHDAIANNRLEVAEFLISKGASMDVRNKQGMLPMDYIRTSAAKEQLLMATSIAQENRDTNIVAVSSPIVRAAVNRRKIILHTCLSPKEKKSLEKCAKVFKAEIVNEFDQKVTHIVSSVDKSRTCNRTMKYLLGVLTGKWIVSSQWISQSLKLGEWVNEEDFEVKGCSGASEDAPKRARLNTTKQFPGLFDGCSFYLSGSFKSTPSKSELVEMIKLGGGAMLHREPKVETVHPLLTPASPAVMRMMSSKTIELPSVAYHAKPDTAQSHCTQYVLFEPECCADHKRISTPILCTAPTSWLMDCVSKFEILEIKDN